MQTHHSIVIGQRVLSCSGERGIVYSVRAGSSAPPAPGSFLLYIVFESGRKFLALSERALRVGDWKILPEVATPQELEEAVQFAAAEEIRQKTEAEIRDQKRAQARETFLREYPHLQPVTEGKNDRVIAAANIRKELRLAFPGIKFRVRGDSFSGGDSIDVSWDLGPRTAEVDAIIGKYQQGSFDGMQDLYEYNADDVWTELFGGAKYVHAQRDAGAAREVIETELRKLVKLPEYDYSTIAWRILSAQSFPAGAVVTGLERTDVTCGLTEEFYRPTFRVEK